MKVKFNNVEFPLTEGISLRQFLAERALHEVKGTAVALNGAVIPRNIWETRELKNNDSILMITASQGG